MTSLSEAPRSRAAHMFWAYGDLSRLETLCARSFVAQGWDLTIWTYGGVQNAPAGAAVRDARDVLPESRVFLNSRGSYAGFSDYFRYAVLNRFGGLYTDTDVIALRPPSAMPQGPFMVTERTQGQQGQAGPLGINGNVLSNPQPHAGNVIDLALAYTHRFPKSDVIWSEIGPALLTAIVSIYPKHGFQIMPPEFANPVDWWRCPSALMSPGESLPESSAFLHLYNEMWRRAGIDKNDVEFPKGSIMHALASTYL